ncbi:hypothetical protein MMC13_002326 [Lambiella insularis]|nr:hypothetical protein [Lambiella insularis]
MQFYTLMLCIFTTIALSIPIAHEHLNSTLESRSILDGQYSTLAVFLYHGLFCEGTGVPYFAIYGNNEPVQDIVSYELDRNLSPGEQLDFSTYAGTTGQGDPCGKFVQLPSIVAPLRGPPTTSNVLGTNEVMSDRQMNEIMQVHTATVQLGTMS